MIARLPLVRPPSAVVLLVLFALAGCGTGGASVSTPIATTSPSTEKPLVVATRPPKPREAPARSPFRFESLGTDSGIDFVHCSGMTPDRHFPTANGSGVAILDYDNDGRMDLYFATCNTLPLETAPKFPNRLYRNLGGGKFQDVTEAAGVGFRGFCHGLIAGDLDNDGDADLILCNYGPNVLYLNKGDGTFRDASKEAGISVPNWSSGGATLDYDNDGDLDVYISNYGSWDINTDGKVWCGNPEKKIRQYCSPRTIKTVRHILYRNDGVTDGVPRFTDVTEAAGVGRSDGHGFGVVAADLDGDGKIDLFVANDQNPSFTFINNGDRTFKDYTGDSGAGYDENGKTQSGMGVDSADIDGDGKEDLLRTNFREETTSLYINQGDRGFLEQSVPLRIASESMPFVKWGCALLDFDNDGYPDLFVTNGHVDDNHHLLGVMNQPYKERPLLMRNDAGRQFTPATAGAGSYFDSDHVGRGAAFGDLDDDGRPDIVVNHKDDPAAVLLNRTETPNQWVRLILKGTGSNRDAIGARVEVTAASRTIYRQKKGGGSMESTNDPRLLIGVGAAKDTVKIVVRWPSGAADSVIEDARVNTTFTVVEPGK